MGVLQLCLGGSGEHTGWNGLGVVEHVLLHVDVEASTWLAWWGVPVLRRGGDCS